MSTTTVGMPIRDLVLLLCLSRFLLLCLAGIADLLIPDHISDQFQSIMLNDTQYFLLTTLANWDGRHFFHIAQYGYTYETNLVFFPLFPVLWRALTPGLLQKIGLTVLAPILLNFVFFIIGGIALYGLSLRIYFQTKNGHNLARIAVILYAFNPASIFFTVAYSEALFACLTFTALYCIFTVRTSTRITAACVYTRLGLAVILFACSSATRSNGVMNAGYLIWLVLGESFCRDRWRKKSLFLAVLACCCIAAPFISFLAFVYKLFCSTDASTQILAKEFKDQAKSRNDKLPGEVGWCNSSTLLLYNAIQKKHWDVAFFGYWQLSKIPLFILALPTIYLVFAATLYYVRLYIMDTRKVHSSSMRLKCLLLSFWLPFICHAFVVCVMGLFIFNVEVITRLIFSGNPILYLYIAEQLNSVYPSAKFGCGNSVGLFRTFIDLTWFKSGYFGKFILLYFAVYFVVGIIMHVNFLPWT